MQRLLSSRMMFYKRTVFLSRIIASTLSLNFFFTLTCFWTGNRRQRQRKDVSWLREHIGKTLLNVHLVLCYFTAWLGKVFVEPEWNPDSLVLIAMIGNCQKEIGVIQAALLKFNMMLNFTWAHTENALLLKDFVVVSTTWFRLIPQGIFKIYQNINTDRF